MEKMIWIHRVGDLYTLADGTPNTTGRSSPGVSWESTEYRLATLGFSASSIHATKTKFDSGETSVVLTVAQP